MVETPLHPREPSLPQLQKGIRGNVGLRDNHPGFRVIRVPDCSEVQLFLIDTTSLLCYNRGAGALLSMITYPLR